MFPFAQRLRPFARASSSLTQLLLRRSLTMNHVEFLTFHFPNNFFPKKSRGSRRSDNPRDDVFLRIRGQSPVLFPRCHMFLVFSAVKMTVPRSLEGGLPPVLHGSLHPSGPPPASPSPTPKLPQFQENFSRPLQRRPNPRMNVLPALLMFS